MWLKECAVRDFLVAGGEKPTCIHGHLLTKVFSVKELMLLQTRWVRRNEDNDTGHKALSMTNRWEAANVNFLYGNIMKTECSPSSS